MGVSGGDPDGLRGSSSGLDAVGTDLAGAGEDIRTAGSSCGDVGDAGVDSALARFSAAATGIATGNSMGVSTLAKAATTNAELLDAATGGS